MNLTPQSQFHRIINFSLQQLPLSLISTFIFTEQKVFSLASVLNIDMGLLNKDSAFSAAA